VDIDEERRELSIKLVYYGPALSGKTTNLRKLHERVAPEARARLISLDSSEDRTLLFDLLPLHLHVEPGVVVKLSIYTVPGQVMHNATRKVVLQGADGVAFIADARLAEGHAVDEAFVDLKQNLRENGLDPDGVPMAFQFNKRDLPGGRTDEDLAGLGRRGKLVFSACALRDEGVLPTFMGLADLTWSDLERRHDLVRRFGIAPSTFRRELAALFGNRL
jgi:signal recognition particle receptor subunit beta